MWLEHRLNEITHLWPGRKEERKGLVVLLFPGDTAPSHWPRVLEMLSGPNGTMQESKLVTLGDTYCVHCGTFLGSGRMPSPSSSASCTPLPHCVLHPFSIEEYRFRGILQKRRRRDCGSQRGKGHHRKAHRAN